MDGSAAGYSLSKGLKSSSASWREIDIEPRRWVAPGYVMVNAITLIVGQPGISKSTIALAWAVALVLNRPFHRFRPSQSYAVGIYGIEDDDDEQRRRLSAILRSFGATPDDVEGQLFRVGPEDIGTLVSRDPETREICLTKAFTDLEQLVEDEGIQVLFLDPMAEMHDLEENDNSAIRVVMAQIRAMAKRRGIAVIITHHTRKGEVKPGDPDASRGASSIIGAARVVFTIAGMSEDEAKAYGISLEARRHYFRMDHAKANYSAAGAAEWFERSTVILDNGDGVSFPSAWAPPIDNVTPEIKDAIASAIARGSSLGPWSPQLTEDPRSIKRLMVDNSVTTQPGQKELLATLEAAGYQRVRFYRASHTDWPVGLRSPDGMPDTVRWETDEEAQARAAKAKPR